MPQTLSSRATVRLKMELKDFYKNIYEMRDADYRECRKCVMAGAAAYVSVAQRHTPPSLGKQDIQTTFYQTLEMDRALEKNERTNGMRVIYYLREAVRNPKTRRLKHMFGKLLRDGYEYCVVIHSKSRKTRGNWTYYKPCKTLDEARKYATEDYRGLMRTAWGLGFIRVSGKMPPVFNRYLERRPKLIKMVNLSETKLHPDGMEIEIVNKAIPDGSSFIPGLDLTSSLAAVKAMNKHMSEYFEARKVTL